MADIVTNLGLSALAKGLTAAPPANWYLAWGTGAGTASAADTALFAEDATAGYARVAATVSIATTNVANDTVQFTGTINAPSATNETITNMGIFDALTGGNLIYHRDFGGSNVTVNSGGPNTGISFTEKIIT